MALSSSNVISIRAQRKKRRALTPQQRNILQAERSGRRTIEARYRARTASEQEVAQARYQANVAEAREKEGIRSRSRFRSAAGRTAVKTARSKNPIIHPIVLIVATMAVVIVFYLTVTSATEFTGFVGSLQNGLKKLSTTSPLFERT